jgi:DNA repair exonuclease SbcCD ATPase subunit
MVFLTSYFGHKRGKVQGNACSLEGQQLCRIDTPRTLLNNEINSSYIFRGGYMPEEDPPVAEVHTGSESNAGKWILLFLAIIYVAASLYFIFTLRGRVDALAKDNEAHKVQIEALTHRMQSAEAEAETLGQQVGITKKELAQRAAALQAQTQAAEARLAEEQRQQITQVTGEVAGVKTDIGGVKTDVASTKIELEATRAKLESAIGDLGVQSGLIARTRGDLEALKHRGDRNYYEFTLLKGAHPQPVSTISLQLKKTDAKRGKFTLNVSADDKTIEKKDRNINEPIQFYTGRERMLYELVIWSVDKKKATGYLSTPKNAPVPVTAGQ